MYISARIARRPSGLRQTQDRIQVQYILTLAGMRLHFLLPISLPSPVRAGIISYANASMLQEKGAPEPDDREIARTSCHLQDIYLGSLAAA